MSGQQYILKLYVTGSSPRSQQAITNLTHLCEKALDGVCNLSVIDVLEQPQAAELEKILVTPTLIKEVPLPKQRIVGDLSNVNVLMRGLSINPTT